MTSYFINISIKSAGNLFIAVLVAFGFALTQAGRIIRTDSSNVLEHWEQFHKGYQTKTEILKKLRAMIGASAQVRYMKSDGPPRDNPNIIKMHAQLLDASYAITTYPSVGVTVREGIALKNFSEAISRTSQALSQLGTANKNQADIQTIDQIIRIASKHAMNALTILEKEVLNAHQKAYHKLKISLSDVQKTFILSNSVIVNLLGVMMIVIFLFFRIHVTQPLGRLSKYITGLEAGNFSTDPPDVRRKDEIGLLSRSIQILKTKYIKQEEVRKREDKRQKVRHKSLRRTLQDLNSSFDEICHKAERSTLISRKAVDKAEQTNETFGKLASTTNKIGQAVILISDVAEQTNRLALSATIEAARAGDTCKGFAIVASEVKDLASQTAQASDEITEHVNEMQIIMEETIGIMNTLGQTIKEMNAVMGSIPSLNTRHDGSNKYNCYSLPQRIISF